VIPSTIPLLITVFIILISFAMIIAVPVIAATPGAWEGEGSSIVYGGAALWSFLVILAGLCSIRV
jgi:photosystem II core protein PsbZ